MIVPLSRDVPGRLWSLWDMRQLFAHNFFKSLEFMLIQRNSLFQGAPQPVDERHAGLLKGTVEALRNHALGLGLKSVVSESDHLLQAIEFRQSIPLSGNRMTELIDAVRRQVDNALLDAAFFHLRADEARWHSGLLVEERLIPKRKGAWETVEILPAVKAAFPTDVPVELQDAWNCHATDNHTACVFHLMRAVEHGLRSLVVAVGVTNPKIPLDYQEWNALIEQVESRSSAAFNSWGKSAEQTNARQFFKRIVADLYLFKDDVRNVTMHTRRRYTAPEAESLIGRVNDWFSVLATKVTEDMTGSTVLDRALFSP